VGDLMLQYRTDPDSILRLNGMGPKGMTELGLALDAFEARIAPSPEPVVELEVPAVTEEAFVETVVSEIQEEAPTEVVTEVETLAVEADQTAVPEEIQVATPEPEVKMVEKEPIEEAEAPQDEAVMVATPVVEEDVTSLDELFALQPEILDVEEDEEEDSDESDKDRKHKKKGKKKKFVEVEYDPERDVTLVRKKHKRGAEWEQDW
jgi:N utilization substance protein A